jgi:WD40 repeat protein
VAIAFDRGGKRLVGLGGNHQLVVVEEGKERLLAAPKVNGIYANLAVAFHPAGQEVTTLGDELRLWDVVSGKQIHQIAKTASFDLQSPCLAYTPDGKTLAASDGAVIRLWDTQTRAERHALRGHNLEVTALAFSPDGRDLYSADRFGTVRRWHLPPPPAVLTLDDGLKHVSGLQGLAFHPDSRHIATAGGDHFVTVWDMVNRKMVLSIPERKPVPDIPKLNLPPGIPAGLLMQRPDDDPRCVAFSPDGKLLAVGKIRHDKKANKPIGGEISLWDFSARREIRTIRGFEQGVTALAFRPDGEWLAAGSQDTQHTRQPGEIKIFETQTGKEVRALPRQPEGVRCLAWSPDGQLLASAGGEEQSAGKVYLWHAGSGDAAGTLEGHKEPVDALAFQLARAGGKDQELLLASTSILGGDTKLWNPRTLAEVSLFTESPGGGHSLAFSPDARRLAIGSGDIDVLGSVVIVDMETGQKLLTLRGIDDRDIGMGFSLYGQRLAFSADGRWLATGGKNGAVKVWGAVR